MHSNIIIENKKDKGFKKRKKQTKKIVFYIQFITYQSKLHDLLYNR